MVNYIVKRKIKNKKKDRKKFKSIFLESFGKHKMNTPPF